VQIAVGMYQNQGAREYQQDAMAIKNFGTIGVLAILADGMGGYEGGEIASRIASEKFREFIIEGEDVGSSLQSALERANRAIGEYKNDHPEVKSMGTTVVACFLTGKSCQWISVGDSPLYLIRNRSRIERINANHSIAGLLDLQVQSGEISREEAQANPQRHMLTSAVSGEEVPTVDLSAEFPVREGDLYILASDGVETLPMERIKDIVLRHVPSVTQENVQNAAEALVDEVIAVGKPGQDNVTVIILGRIEENEPTTRMFSPAAERKKLWALLLAGVLTLLAVAGLILFGGSDKDVEKTHRPTGTVQSPAPKKPVHGAIEKARTQAHSQEQASPVLEKKGADRTTPPEKAEAKKGEPQQPKALPEKKETGSPAAKQKEDETHKKVIKIQMQTKPATGQSAQH